MNNWHHLNLPIPPHTDLLIRSTYCPAWYSPLASAALLSHWRISPSKLPHILLPNMLCVDLEHNYMSGPGENHTMERVRRTMKDQHGLDDTLAQPPFSQVSSTDFSSARNNTKIKSRNRALIRIYSQLRWTTSY